MVYLSKNALISVEDLKILIAVLKLCLIIPMIFVISTQISYLSCGKTYDTNNLICNITRDFSLSTPYVNVLFAFSLIVLLMDNDITKIIFKILRSKNEDLKI